MPNKLKPAVGYIRMSTDRQEDSPARQRRDIEALAKRMGFRILRWYEDHGLTGTDSANRPEFQRLLDDAKKGKFAAVLLSEQSRMSREDIFDAMLHWRRLRDAGVRIVTCQRGELDFDNLGGVITAIVDQYGARQESIKLAERVASGQRNRALAGKRIGGVVFGYDREMIDESGNVVKVVHLHERFRKPRSWESRLIPSQDGTSVEAVQWAFDAFCRGKGIAAIADEFNRRRLRTTFGNHFTCQTIRSLLENPVYVGVLRVGQDSSRSKFATITEEPILVENAHEPLVSMALFERAQKLLADRKGKTPHATTTFYILSGIVLCGHCGQRMHGVHTKERKAGENRKEQWWHQCSRGSDGLSRRRPCDVYPRIRADLLETAVLDVIRTELLTADAEARIRDAVVRATRQDKTSISREQRKLDALRKKIARGTENLALASEEDFAGIAKLLSKWREEEAKLALGISRRSETVEAVPEAMRVLANMTLIRENLDLADKQTLRMALAQTIDHIAVFKHSRTSGEVEYTETTADIHFHPVVLDGKCITLPSRLFVRTPYWQQIAEMARRMDEPFHLKDVQKLINTPDASHAHFHVRRAMKAGVIRRLPGPAAGWVAAG
ncbi:MAG: recombinase family protein [Candidatus Nealsonbacteria bacterium]|nr:recombinase family protein [Candidatus Nealsonbacteria bacterium]